MEWGDSLRSNNDDLNSEWYSVIAREGSFLKMTVNCPAEQQAGKLMTDLSALAVGELALRPIEFSCGDGRKVNIKIKTYAGSWYNHWDPDKFEERDVTTLDELVTFLLQRVWFQVKIC